MSIHDKISYMPYFSIPNDIHKASSDAHETTRKKIQIAVKKCCEGLSYMSQHKDQILK